MPGTVSPPYDVNSVPTVSYVEETLAISAVGVAFVPIMNLGRDAKNPARCKLTVPAYRLGFRQIVSFN
jgi:hypothetical protein